MTLPQLQRPSAALRIPIKINGLARVKMLALLSRRSISAFLNLTQYKPPAPDDYYFGQRQLSTEIRDIYGQLNRWHAGTAGKFEAAAILPRRFWKEVRLAQKPLALYSGIVRSGRMVAEVVFDFRILPVAPGSWSWPGVATRSAAGRRRCHDPGSVVLTATLPRFLLNGDRGSMHLDVDNVEVLR